MRHERHRDNRRESTSAAFSRAGIREPRSAGRPLPADVRDAIGPRFGHDFSQVRVHDDAESARLAADLDARAVTVGTDVYFGDAEFAPEAAAGAHLLAHELAHVVQHERGGRSHDRVSDVHDGAEIEAWQAADAVLTGAMPTIGSPGGATVARGSMFSTIGSLLSFPKKTMNELAGLSPITSTLGALGGIDNAMHAEDGAGVASGLMGAGSGILGLTSWMGEDWMKGTPTGNALGGIGGLLGAGSSAVDAYSDFSKGNYGKGALDTTKAVGGTLSGLGSLGGFSLSSVGEMGALEALAGGGGEGLAALGPAGAVIGAGMAGYGMGTFLSENTSVGEHSVDTMGALDAMLTGDGERSWMLSTTEAMEDDWDQGNYLSAVGEGAELAGVATLGALGGIGGGIVDAGEAIGGGIADAASWVGDNLNPLDWF